MEYADYQFLKFDRKPNGVLLVTINRPEKMNAATTRMHSEFAEIWKTVKSDPETRVVVVTGDGDVLMALGSLATIGVKQPKNLVIVCLDNGHYSASGMQPTATKAGVEAFTRAHKAYRYLQLLCHR